MRCLHPSPQTSRVDHFPSFRFRMVDEEGGVGELGVKCAVGVKRTTEISTRTRTAKFSTSPRAYLFDFLVNPSRTTFSTKLTVKIEFEIFWRRIIPRLPVHIVSRGNYLLRLWLNLLALIECIHNNGSGSRLGSAVQFKRENMNQFRWVN